MLPVMLARVRRSWLLKLRRHPMPDEKLPPLSPDHIAPGRSSLAKPDPRTTSARQAANTPLAEDRHAARGQIEDKAAESNLSKAE